MHLEKTKTLTQGERKPPGKWLLLAVLWIGPSSGAVCIMAMGAPRWIAAVKGGTWTFPLDLALSLGLLILHLYWIHLARVDRAKPTNPGN